MSRADPSDERLVARVLAGDAASTRSLVDLAARVIWPAARQLAGDGPEGETAFLVVMKALRDYDFARLRRFDGSCTLSRFLLLVTRDVLGEDAAKAFSLDPNHAWRKFETFFGADIRRRIRARFPRADEAQRDDLYQDVVLKLVEADFKRIKAFSGSGSFTGYILGMIENLIMDLLRREAGRRRLPAAVLRLSVLHHAVFAAVVWRDVPTDPRRLAPAIRAAISRDANASEIQAALTDLGPHLLKAREDAARNPPLGAASEIGDGELQKIADPGLGGEEKILRDAEDQSKDALIALIRRKSDDLPKVERLYLQLAFYAAEPAKPNEIAKTMSVPVKEVYRLRERTVKWLRGVAQDFQPTALT